MKYLTRYELIKKITSEIEVPVSTLQRYIYDGTIKTTKYVNRRKMFSESYVNKILKCIETKKSINWKLVEQL